MALGLIDLSIITERLIAQLTASTTPAFWAGSGTPVFTVNYTGLAPDAVRADTGCQVSLYLFHATVDKFHRNTYPTGGSAQRIPEQPLSLTLYYLLTAHSATSSLQEQQAMSIALKCFHEQPIVRMTLPVSGDAELTLTLEPQTIDEIGRLWQAIGTPMRLSTVYRVGVVFLRPPEPRAPQPVLHPPDFAPPHDVHPMPTIPGPLATRFAVDATTGRATIAIPRAGFAATTTTAKIRALPLVPSTTDPPPPGAFRVVDADTLDVHVPVDTPAGAYLVTVRPGPAVPALEIWLDVA